ncbi:MAG: serine protease [Chitinivibrionales bacterium]|nr:serine protease [Chitinivibrionales bacterium]MBD3355657.1 serine protease [Chitinivibrionales bacterium]
MGDILLAVVLQIVGVSVIIAELVLPSGGLLTIVAVGSLGYSLFHVFTRVSVGAGMVFVAADLVMIPIAIVIGIKLLVKSPVTLRSSLSSQEGVASQDPLFKELKGKEGTALTALRPSGKAKIEGKRYDVVSGGDYVDAGAAIKVTIVDGNRIVVRKVAPKQ